MVEDFQWQVALVQSGVFGMRGVAERVKRSAAEAAAVGADDAQNRPQPSAPAAGEDQ